mmetsp:Transcript_120360/g.236555  ORF Transcript_120360/g.236555 Transcript_120360/m.236555 type:complete len:271 (+) Transcript_120360:425-1237(+)
MHPVEAILSEGLQGGGARYRRSRWRCRCRGRIRFLRRSREPRMHLVKAVLRHLPEVRRGILREGLQGSRAWCRRSLGLVGRRWRQGDARAAQVAQQILRQELHRVVGALPEHGLHGFGELQLHGVLPEIILRHLGTLGLFILLLGLLLRWRQLPRLSCVANVHAEFQHTDIAAIKGHLARAAVLGVNVHCAGPDTAEELDLTVRAIPSLWELVHAALRQAGDLLLIADTHREEALLREPVSGAGVDCQGDHVPCALLWRAPQRIRSKGHA